MKIKLYNMISLALIFGSLALLNNAFGQFELGNTSTILTTDINEAVNTDVGSATIGDPIRQGAYQVVRSDDGDYTLAGIVDNDNEITQHSTALNRTLGIINNIINRALGILSLVALIYLIVHGFIMITAAGDETKYKKGLKGIKYAAIAIAGIGLSRFIISLIFRIIEGITTGT